MPCSYDVLDQQDVATWDPLMKNDLKADYFNSSVESLTDELDTKSTTKFCDANEAISIVNLALSDFQFDYSQNTEDSTYNTISLMGSHSSSDSIRGVVSGSSIASVTLSSLNLPYVYPTLLQLVSDKKSCVFHVSSFELSNSLHMKVNNEHNLQIIKDSGVLVLFSSTPQEG